MQPIKSTAPPYVDLNGKAVRVSFIAMEYYAIILNRSFAVVAGNKMLCGAKAIGLVASPRDGYGIYLWRNPGNFISPKTIAKYQRIDPESAQFLKIDSANFQINYVDITTVRFSAKKKLSMGAITHAGSLYITTNNGKKREFILLGKQDGDDIQSQLLGLCPNATRGI